jgi:glycosyltransferase involved in cell wall biosynthesis
LWSLATDFEGLSSNFDKLYSNPELRREMGENGFNFFLNNYTVDKTYDSIINSLNI